MNKHDKLQRYDRKDYSDLVDFPVEIVGRDQVVRRYSFEDSIRLYQRRVTFAPIRYRDGELVRAESEHCQSRIQQLRRSYFVQYGWGAPEGSKNGELLFGSVAGEIAAFLRRVLRCSGRPDVAFERLGGEEDASTWFLKLKPNQTMVLYVYRFDTDDTVQDRFFKVLKKLERTGKNQGDGERLIAFHHMVDCGLIITGRGAAASLLSENGASAEDDARAAQVATPWDEALELMRQGEHEMALWRCQELVKQQPWHRRAYVAGAMLANRLGKPVVAEDLALLGERYFNEDADLLHQAGVAQLYAGKATEAVDVLQRACRRAPEVAIFKAFLAIALFRVGRRAELIKVLTPTGEQRCDDKRIDLELGDVRRAVGQHRYVTVVAGVLCVLAVLGLSDASALPIAFSAAGLAMLFLVRVGERRTIDTLAARLFHDGLTLGLRRLSRRGPEQRVV